VRVPAGAAARILLDLPAFPLPVAFATHTMKTIGIFFGTETGTTRLIAKKIQRKLGDGIAANPST
jgi:hypothetical protein